MNWVDGILLLILLASVILGSKKGLIRELMAFVIFFTAVIVSVNYIDRFAVWVFEQIGGSPLISAFLSFIILLALSYATFKILGLIFYKVAQIKQIGKKDQMGGALVGFLRGWVAIGFLTFLVFLLPMPTGFYTAFENSFFGPAVAKTVPLMFETTSKIHPKNNNFMEQIEKTLLDVPANSDKEVVEEDQIEIHRVLYQMDRFFSTANDGA